MVEVGSYSRRRSPVKGIESVKVWLKHPFILNAFIRHKFEKEPDFLEPLLHLKQHPSIVRMINQLPNPSEVPRVSQSELRSLYTKFTSGVEDLELLEEIESKLAARIELRMQWQSILDFFVAFVDEFDNPEPSEKDMESNRWVENYGTSNRWVEKYGTSYDDWLQDFLFETCIDDYSTITSGTVTNEVLKPYHTKMSAFKGSFASRMLTIDKLVHLVHDSGPMAGSFIESHPVDTEKFLDMLEAGK